MNFEKYGRRRVVVTGMGAVTPYGDLNQMWDGFISGHSCITRIQEPWADHVPVKIAGQVRDFDPQNFLTKKEARRISRPSQFAIAAAQMAEIDASIKHRDGERTAVVVGTTMGPHLLAESMTTKYRQNGHRRPNPVLFANCLPNMPAHFVSERIGALGPQVTPVAACATGTQAIGDAVDLIRYGRADIVFAGGVETIIQDYIIAGFASLSALVEGYNDNPAEASRPFDANRSGFVLTEGCGILVLESLEHAYQRGARIYAEVLGHASSADAYHIAAIEPEGDGMQRAMRWALADAHINADEVDYINTHGTSTEPNDRIETNAIKQIFGDYAYTINLSSNKSMLGHAMAAAGALEAVATILTLKHGIIPPTINYHIPDPNCDLDYTPNKARVNKNLEIAMSNNFGLGGQNASVIFRLL